MIPTRSVNASTIWTYPSVPDADRGATVAAISTHAAVLGPERTCQEDPHSAAIMTGKMLV